MFTVEFSDPYVGLLESFGEPDEPFRTIEDVTDVQFYHGDIDVRTSDGTRIWELAKVGWDGPNDHPTYTTADGKKWAQMTIRDVDR